MEVKVYSTDTCPWCTKVKEYLDKLGVKYTPVNVSTDRAAAMELVKKTKQMGVPVTTVGDKFVVGYNPSELEAVLKENNLIS
ncbi:glutaredoxin family protein [Cloacibacillus evryensis]|uniref:Glutaredoxin family protein n=2 Tax=root TaxID=1 RepID=A0AAW5JZD0_9BACT|nr:glutaredoxin family protein [Cloacibacillus evryensis]EHL65367.1 glutaredoxin-like protein, YruB-family [Synergistes sp. 3_1_syn1]MCQ4765259.1 glutaredoxin family protein [Cloacibacillus evryensis]MCQ4812874.1 glutaredoxin family protein [Cloacibacillus evryensis]MEA5035539.1 glutaredoxin family protein [Cloacibacillus evryensis]